VAPGHGPAQPGGADQSGDRQRLAFGHEAVVKRQLTGPEIAADQQAMPGEAVASQDQAYQRSFLSFPAQPEFQCPWHLLTRHRCTVAVIGECLGITAGTPDFLAHI
jgi:hypothetical protein